MTRVPHTGIPWDEIVNQVADAPIDVGAILGDAADAVSQATEQAVQSGEASATAEAGNIASKVAGNIGNVAGTIADAYGGYTNQRATDAEFRLDTKNFNTLIKESKSLAEEMRDMKVFLDAQKNTLILDWIGTGSNTFQKKFRLLTQQLSDLKDDMSEISEKLTSDYEQYMLWDTENAKRIDGVQDRDSYVGSSGRAFGGGSGRSGGR